MAYVADLQLQFPAAGDLLEPARTETKEHGKNLSGLAGGGEP